MNILEEDYCCLSLLFKPNEEKTVVTENPLSAPQLKKETDAKVVKEKEKAFKVGNEKMNDSQDGIIEGKDCIIDLMIENQHVEELGKEIKIQSSFHFHDRKYHNDLLNSAEVFCRNNWNLTGQALVSIIHNPFIEQRSSPIISKFSNALEEHEISLSSEDSFVFAWHGTQNANIVNICRDGFDVYKRQGQQYGVGEYFGTNCGISHGYCKGGYFMLLCLLLKGDWLTEHPGSSYVCNNPIPSYSTYSLPLIVINFGVEEASPFQ